MKHFDFQGQDVPPGYSVFFNRFQKKWAFRRSTGEVVLVKGNSAVAKKLAREDYVKLAGNQD